LKKSLGNFLRDGAKFLQTLDFFTAKTADFCAPMHNYAQDLSEINGSLGLFA
jgi:hypothetical protein